MPSGKKNTQIYITLIENSRSPHPVPPTIVSEEQSFIPSLLLVIWPKEVTTIEKLRCGDFPRLGMNLGKGSSNPL